MMKSYRVVLSISIILFMEIIAYGQEYDSTANKPDQKKINTFLIASGVTYGVSLVLLNELWYKDYPRGKFHFFNDNAEWRKMDKVGHSFSAYHISRISFDAFTNAGYNYNKSLIAAGLTSFIIMTPIEWLDGYSTAYGASLGDIMANTLGFIFFSAQSIAFNKQIVSIKYGFWPSPFAVHRPEVLGKSLPEQMFKDYNGQTFWFSIDLHQLISDKIPQWLNLGIGYGANGMVHAREQTNSQFGYRSYSQWYLSIDPDFSYIHSKNNFAKLGIQLLKMIRIPAPSLEFSQNSLKWHWLSF